MSDHGPNSSAGHEVVTRLVRDVIAGRSVETDGLEVALADVPERLGPLVAFTLLEGPGDHAPRVEARLRETNRRATVAWLGRTPVIQRIREGLGDAGVPAAFLKGVPLAESGYPAPRCRPMIDVDVWVPTEFHSTAISALETRGFEIPSHHEGAFPNHGPEPTVPLVATFGAYPMFVELHGLPMSLSDLPGSCARHMWERRQESPTGLPVLDVVDQVIHVCLHISHKIPFTGQVHGLVDVAYAVKALSREDWRELVRRVEEMRRIASVWTVLQLSHELLGADVPADVLGRLQPHGSKDLLRAARDQLWIPYKPLVGAVAQLFGGGRSTGRWFWERTVGQHWRANSDLGLGRRLGAALAGLMHDVNARRRAYWRLLVRGDFFTGTFWSAALGSRRRGRLLRRLDRADARGPQAGNS